MTSSFYGSFSTVVAHNVVDLERRVVFTTVSGNLHKPVPRMWLALTITFLAQVVISAAATSDFTK